MAELMNLKDNPAQTRSNDEAVYPGMLAVTQLRDETEALAKAIRGKFKQIEESYLTLVEPDYDPAFEIMLRLFLNGTLEEYLEDMNQNVTRMDDALQRQQDLMAPTGLPRHLLD
jgi:hypothetical protein